MWFTLPVHFQSGFVLSSVQIDAVLLNHLTTDTEIRGRSTLTMVPQSTMREFYLPLSAFNVGRDSKNGCGGGKKQPKVIQIQC